MPALYALGQHEALSQVHATLRQGEMLFAHLDDICVLCDPSRVAEIFLQVKLSLFRSAGIQVNLGKTKIWNSAGIKPEDLDTVGAEAWTGDGPEEVRGLVVLAVPVGHRAFVQKWLADKGQSHAQFLSRIRVVQDAQSAWLLLLMCAGPRAHYILRNLPPSAVNSVRTTTTDCGSAFHTSFQWRSRWCGFRGVAFPGRRAGSSERCEIGTSGLLGILGRLSVSGARTSTTCVCSWKNWGGQSGPDSLSPISARRNLCGLTVGNFTLQLLATPFLQLACTCHSCPQTTELCRHRNEVLVLRATSAVCPLVRRPLFRLKSSARCS